MADIDELPTEVTNLDQIIDAIQGALGAIGALDHQVGQMSGMFNDEDGTIQDAVDAGEHADAHLRNALAFAQSLKADAAFSAAMDDAGEEAGSVRDADLTSQALALTAPFPTVDGLLSMRDDLAQAVSDAFAQAEGDEGMPGDVTLDVSNAETIIVLIEGAARSAATPVEVAIHVDGGAVQGVTRVAEDGRPLSVYVHDHDVDGRKDAEADPELGHIQFDNSEDGELDPCNLAVHTGGQWEEAPGDGPYWRTLRSETARLEASA